MYLPRSLPLCDPTVATWAGDSGRRYDFVVSRPAMTWLDEPAVYILVKREGQQSTALHVGQTSSLNRRFGPSTARCPEVWRRALSMGMTQVHLRFEACSERARRAEVRDLVAALRPPLNDSLMGEPQRQPSVAPQRPPDGRFEGLVSYPAKSKRVPTDANAARVAVAAVDKGFTPSRPLRADPAREEDPGFDEDPAREEDPGFDEDIVTVPPVAAPGELPPADETTAGWSSVEKAAPGADDASPVLEAVKPAVVERSPGLPARLAHLVAERLVRWCSGRVRRLSAKAAVVAALPEPALRPAVAATRDDQVVVCDAALVEPPPAGSADAGDAEAADLRTTPIYATLAVPSAGATVPAPAPAVAFAAALAAAPATTTPAAEEVQPVPPPAVAATASAEAPPQSQEEAKRSLDLDSSAPVVLFAGDVSYAAGADILFDAMLTVCGDHRQVQFVFAGDGALRADLEERAARAGLAHRCRFLGDVATARFEHVLAACDFVAVPARVQQGQELAKLALSHGKPVLVTHQAGIAVVVHGENGLVTYDNPGSFVWGVRALLGPLCGSLRRHLAEAA